MSEIHGDISLPSQNDFMRPESSDNHIQVLEENWLGEKENATFNQNNIHNCGQ